MSGGRATIGLRSGKVRSAQAGDITGIDPMAARLLNHVSVECKSYEDLHLFRGVTNDTGRLHDFWEEHREKSSKFSKAPMLIARQNGIPTVCLVPCAALMPLFGLADDCVSATLPRWGCHVVLFEAFLREARVPELESVTINRGRVYLSA
ncbi:MAG: hypothetical protein KGO96_10165 [Elusimicrobia bacterium]|nr:hypothetical protein [Elusimicrobiota bacterium]